MGLLDRRDTCTLLTAVDNHYLDKLCLTFPTWLLCHPELLNMPVLIMYDADQVKADDPRFRKLVENWVEQARKNKISHKLELQVIPWRQETAESQREKMLTSLVHAAAYINTPWYFKLDADTFANRKTGFYYDRWFRGGPCFIGNPWGYTKPATALETMNAWKAQVPELADLPDVQGQVIMRDGQPWKVNHHRMASWTMFGSTAWSQQALTYLEDIKLPFPSQDTYLSYIQAVTQAPWVPVKFRQFGFDHARNFNGLKAACAQSIAENT